MQAQLKLPHTCVQDIWLEQEDAQAIAEGEEVTLMDWGNAIVQARRASCTKPGWAVLCLAAHDTGIPHPAVTHVEQLTNPAPCMSRDAMERCVLLRKGVL